MFFIFRERVPCVCRGRPDSAETEQPRAITVDLGEAFWTLQSLLSSYGPKPLDAVSFRTVHWHLVAWRVGLLATKCLWTQSPFGLFSGSSPLILWGRAPFPPYP